MTDTAGWLLRLLLLLLLPPPLPPLPLLTARPSWRGDKLPARLGVTIRDVGSDSLDAIALHLALLDIPFTPLEPPELRDHCAVLPGRLRQAANRYPAAANR